MRLIIILLYFALTHGITAQDFDYNRLLSDSTRALRDSTNLRDSLSLADTNKIKKEKLVPLYDEALLRKSALGTQLTTSELYKSNYRYTGNFSSLYPFGFLQDLGSLGQPNEVTLFGLGYGNVSFSKNGVSINNRWQNSYNLYYFQSESIDSMELVPLPRGFLYSSTNNPVTVNFITKSDVAFQPHSRIRFYQAPNDEALIDVLFNAYLFKRTNVRFQITNSSVESFFRRENINSGFSSWKVMIDLRYMMSNSVNIIGSYNHVKSDVGLYGGVLTDTEARMFNPNLSDPVYSDRSQITTRHNFNIKILSKFIEDMPGDLNLFYQFNNKEFSQGFEAQNSSLPQIKNNNEYKVFGANLRQILLLNFLQFDLLADYEQTDYQADVLKENKSENLLSIAGKTSINIIQNVSPSVYLKYLKYNSQNFFGIGADVSTTISRNLVIYGGASYFDKPYSILERQYSSNDILSTKQNIKTLELGAKFKFPHINGSASYFYYSNNGAAVPVIDIYADSLLINEVGSFNTAELNSSGINLSFDLRMWKILFSSNISHYFNYNDFNSVPKTSVQAGVYYIDKLFKGHLNLKAGFNFRYTGSKNYLTYDFEKSIGARYFKNESGTNFNLINDELNPASHQLDLFIAATIDELAIFYFVFENILDNKFFIIPRYPMYPRALRFGVSWDFLD